MSIDNDKTDLWVCIQEFADVKSDVRRMNEASLNHTSRLETIETTVDDDRLNLKLLAKEVQDLADAVRENNKLLKGANGNSILVRLALMEASHSELQGKVDKGSDNSANDNRAKLQLIGTTLAAGLALVGTIVIGIFSLLG